MSRASSAARSRARDRHRIEAELASPALDAFLELDSRTAFPCPDGSAESHSFPTRPPRSRWARALARRARAGTRRSTCAASSARARPRSSAGMLRALGYAGPVKSPTYTLVELYEVSRLHLHHFDFYRFHDPREWIDAGFRESFNGRNCEPGRMAGEGRWTAAAARTWRSPWNCSGDGSQCRAHVELARRAEVPRRCLEASLRRRFLKFAAARARARRRHRPRSPARRSLASRVWPAQEYTRVTLESAQPVKHQFFFVTNPERLVVDLEGVELDDELKALPAKVGANDPYIQAVRVGREPAQRRARRVRPARPR